MIIVDTFEKNSDKVCRAYDAAKLSLYTCAGNG
jgi:hypothetical protein